MGSFLVTPNKYAYYDCAQLAVALAGVQGRERQLTALKAKAEASPGGGLVSAVSYQPEYYQMRGEINEVHRTAAEKNCKSIPNQARAR